MSNSIAAQASSTVSDTLMLQMSDENYARSSGVTWKLVASRYGDPISITPSIPKKQDDFMITVLEDPNIAENLLNRLKEAGSI